ncbi:MAG: hypothetical protein Q9169_006368 [Polycauliona sp. 2 TL-2023]
MSNKRKAIDDFFLPVKKNPGGTANAKTQLECESDQTSRTTTGIETSVPGLILYTNFISGKEEADILAFLNDAEQCAWRTDLSRRTMHFGGTYCVMPQKANASAPIKPTVLQAPPMPQKLQWLIQRMEASDIYNGGRRPQYCIVNEYTGDLGISAHTENFQFGEPVVGLSLSSPCPIRFHELASPFDGSVRSGKAAKAQKTGRAVDVHLPSRSLLVMTGPSRWSWQHEIVRSAKGRGPLWKRVSLTFRYKP